MAYYTVDTLIALLSITAIDRARSAGRLTLQWWYFTTLGAMGRYLRPLKTSLIPCSVTVVNPDGMHRRVPPDMMGTYCAEGVAFYHPLIVRKTQ